MSLHQNIKILLISLITIISISGCVEDEPEVMNYEQRMTHLLQLTEMKRKCNLPDIPVPDGYTPTRFKRGTSKVSAIKQQSKTIRILSRRLYITRKNIINFNNRKHKYNDID